MNKETKIAIIEAAKQYMELHGLSQKQLADATGINPAYLNVMLAGEIAVRVKDKPVAISQKWFAMLANFIGFNYEKQFWPFIPTPEFVQIVGVLELAKEHMFTNVVICDTGIGKTHAVEKFEKKFPQQTYVLTVSRLHKITEILTELCEKLNITPVHVNSSKLHRIILKLRDISLNGANPIVIIDEAENLQLPVLQMLKALYDGVKMYCSVVLIGTSQLINKLDKMEAQDKDGMPQFCRRFRAGRRVINKVNDFRPFYEALDITEPSLIKLINRLARNYGELRDYLEPVLREADRSGMPVNETLFRQVHYLPIYQTT